MENMRRLHSTLVERGATKREVIERIVDAVQDAFPAMDNHGLKTMSWWFYRELCRAGR